MKLVKISNDIIRPVVADVFKSSSPPYNTYYNILIDTNTDRKFKKHIKLDSKLFGTPIVNKRFELLGDDYILKEMTGNYWCKYILSKDNSYVHRNDILLIWELPLKNYKDISYNIEGQYNTLIETSYSKSRGGVRYSSPIVVMELMGDTTLYYTTDNVTNKIVFNYHKGWFNFVKE